MRTVVIDSSVTLASVLKDEQSEVALRIFEAIENAEVHVPTLWWMETANALLMAERRKRISQAEVSEALQMIHMLGVRTDTEVSSQVVHEAVSLARQHGLTVYDAAYLELTIRHNAILATTDKLLEKAARSVGIKILN
jgi:predicted nucleic acid-binding protein